MSVFVLVCLLVLLLLICFVVVVAGSDTSYSWNCSTCDKCSSLSVCGE